MRYKPAPPEFERLRRHLLWRDDMKKKNRKKKLSKRAPKRCTSKSPDIYKSRCVKAAGHRGEHSVWPIDKGSKD